MAPAHFTLLWSYFNQCWPLVYVSKKHFIRIAALLRSAQKHCQGLSVDQTVEIIRENLAEILSDTNPNFDRTRFLEACNVKH